MAGKKVLDAPWDLTADGESPHLTNFALGGALPNIADLSALDLLIALRNAVAHGDSRMLVRRILSKQTCAVWVSCLLHVFGRPLRPIERIKVILSI